MIGLSEAMNLTPTMRNSELSVGARLLWWELNQWISDDLHVCFPTQKALAENLGVHRNSVIRWLQELREYGLVEDVPQRHGNAYALIHAVSGE